MSGATAVQRVRHAYRSMAKLVGSLPENKMESAKQEMRQKFRQPLAADETLDGRLKTAGEKIAFLRIVTPARGSRQGDGNGNGNGGRWIYKDGKRIEGGAATTRGGGKVHSNWDGKNLDPCSVKRHGQQLKRAGFVNNLHAKGLF
eukprot:CAMPEP_0202441396 /NCGR_PEP_ID=MMETSP1360-20130828/894_1 /ASSEMBLY_ACC=CAM_ASM_000848 /TAXON_ID=515479 /ORGANISM="Licmophora paradoxa, Strain CCMP2313" /LENGTH=144 /DNA_ID=CAMNT_0049056369 /DNA_START=6 /DNA_END=440 /DNA_ORIENTATION=+